MDQQIIGHFRTRGFCILTIAWLPDSLLFARFLDCNTW
jgi:hypothetical protein